MKRLLGFFFDKDSDEKERPQALNPIKSERPKGSSFTPIRNEYTRRENYIPARNEYTRRENYFPVREEFSNGEYSHTVRRDTTKLEPLKPIRSDSDNSPQPSQMGREYSKIETSNPIIRELQPGNPTNSSPMNQQSEPIKPLDKNSPRYEQKSFYDNNGGKAEKPYQYTRPAYENVKLTIVLLENTVRVERSKEKIKKIVKSLATSGILYVINYGATIREFEEKKPKDFDLGKLFCIEDLGNKACLYDALVILEKVVSKYYNMTEWSSFKRTKISGIDIIGIGRCIDTCSIVSNTTGIESFIKAVNRSNITTKYFCMDENNFINAAAVGFRSIGAIDRTMA